VKFRDQAMNLRVFGVRNCCFRVYLRAIPVCISVVNSLLYY